MDLKIDPRLVMQQAAASRANAAPRKDDPEKLLQRGREFEAILVQSLFKGMRSSVPDSGLFEKDSTSEIYRDMLDAEVARQISETQGLGIAEALFRQLAPKGEK